MSRKAVAAESGLSEQDVEKVCDAIVSICDRGGKVAIRGFGTFSPKEVPAVPGNQPLTGEPYCTKPYRTIIFRGSSKLRDRMWKCPDTN